MKNSTFSTAWATAVIAAALCAGSRAQAQWNQWGGKDRDFKADGSGLAAKWPKDGPKKIWTRPLGNGYSSILVDGDALITMYRNGDDEVITALDRSSGKTIWEHTYNAPVPEGMETRFGKGPNSTPLVHDGRVYTLGVAGHVHCVDRRTGKPVWTHNLVDEYTAKAPEFGFSSSPIAVDDRVIVAGGGPGCAVVAFDAKTGDLRWKKHDYENIYSSPVLARNDGDTDLVLLADTHIIGLDPKTGDERWKFPHENQWKVNISTPVIGDDGLLFATSGGEAGGRALRLARTAGKVEPKELWANNKFGVGQTNVIRVGDTMYGSSGYSPTFITAVNVKTGEVLWQERGFAKATLTYVDGRLLILDEEAKLALAEPTPTGLNILCETKLGQDRTWTIPTVVGKTMYLRDGHRISAFDLG